ncbi:hypothetical protein IMSHALPRED_010057 [Imshaugia aleurites]|uniref:RRM domain-containing protein n=1 Tax=Imshaugia aleurites TaxID=172621 RepID=A0A8H3IV71_9LECA|nr:hypothetical protein IMSHALPRED_010057 [Imshaugia aleurites]
MADKAGRVVFIGNIPYGLTEEQIIHIFSQVGQVLNFRLVYDNDTGKPKGFGFAEFADTDAAASAVRNLNNHEIMGRELRVDFSHVGGKDDGAPSGYNAQHPPQSQPPNGYQPPVPGSLPPLPPGIDLQPNITCPDAISKTLSTLPAPQLLDILSQMKGLVMGDPAKATELLKQAPQLAYAIFQALLLMGLVDTSVLGSVVEQASHPAQPPAHAVPPRPAPAYQPPAQYSQYPPISGQMHAPTPPVHNQLYQPPPAQPLPPQQQPANQEELLQQILNMPQSQIDQLAPADRAQIMAVRQQLRGF